MRLCPRLLAFALLPALTLGGVAGCDASVIEWHPPVSTGCSGAGCASEVELCEVVVCLAGAGGDLSDGNDLLGELCDALPGVVRRCQYGGCNPLFDDASSALVALADVTTRVAAERFPRRDDERRVPRPAAEGCVISLLGHSWGGVNAAELASLVVDAADIPPELRRVDRAVLVDAYSPFAGGVIDVPGSVRRAWSYRHSAPNRDDCSKGLPLSPYVGLPIRCGEETLCADHDLSLAANDVGHCRIITDVGSCLIENLVDGRDCSAPPPATTVLSR